MPGEVEKVRVRREELAKAIEDNVQQKRSFLDLETGDVVSVFLDMVERGQDQTAKRIAAGVNTRYILLPSMPAREGYAEMERFIESVPDKKLAAELSRAIEGEGAFRKFRDALRMHRTELDRWYAEKEARVDQAIASWLASKKLVDRVELY
jgi:hypothetical protein